MAIPASPNSVSFSDLQNEFGGLNPISFSEYYRNAGLVPNSSPPFGSVPAFSNPLLPISISSFRGLSSAIIVTIGGIAGTDPNPRPSPLTNQNTQSLFTIGGINYWTTNVTKILIIKSGAEIGSTNRDVPALRISSGLQGQFIIQNNGTISGAGGIPGVVVAQRNGGDAIYAESNATIQNNGTIRSGGGAGGQGGKGGDGLAYSSTVQSLGPASNYTGGSCSTSCVQRYGPGAYCAFATPTCYNGGNPNFFKPQCNAPNVNRTCRINIIFFVGYFCNDCRRNVTSNITLTGGNGGNGGIGQGYNQLPTNGTLGLPGQTGGTGGSAGTGGTGGNGGTWGNSGTGGTAGTNGLRYIGPTVVPGDPGGPPGSAGASVRRIGGSTVTISPTGTILGPII